MSTTMTFPGFPVSSFGDYQNFLAQNHETRRERRDLERKLAVAGESFVVHGHCAVCDQQTDFQVDWRYSYEVEGVLMPNWREHLRCPACGLNNRIRATLHIFQDILKPNAQSKIYITERLTPLYEWLIRRYPSTESSEYLGTKIPWGATDERDVRNEDLTRLTFASSIFDFVISLDVIEHVPDFEKALAEIWRVLKPGGILFFSAPFRADLQENLVRARITENGEIEHLLEPEYHGDPLSDAGCLAFYHFGWQLVDQCREAGFSDVQGQIYWSEKFAYLGQEHPVFIARKL